MWRKALATAVLTLEVKFLKVAKYLGCFDRKFIVKT